MPAHTEYNGPMTRRRNQELNQHKLPNGDFKDHDENDVLANSFHEYERLTQNRTSVRIRNFLHHTGIPIFLMTFVPNLVVAMWYANFKCDGSYLGLVSLFKGRSPYEAVAEMYRGVTIGGPFTARVLIGYCAWALVMMRLLPGKMVDGPVTPTGHVPVYKDNGFLYFLTTVGTFIVLTPVFKHVLGVSPSSLYDNFGGLLITLNAFSFIFCLMLYFKGRFAPSGSDSGTTGNIIFDYYWGTELYPRIFGFDIKVFTNCRFGMMVWALLVLSFAVKSYELHGFVDSMFVSTTLQIIYITKFYWWESGYLRTIDIMLDRAGFYICWGCLVYIPGMYTSVSLFLVSHPVQLGPWLTSTLLFIGIAAIYINYQADMQKKDVRYANGNCLIWGKKPKLIRATYKLESGEVRENILLASGWWGLSRHFHYIPELLLAFCWCVPALFTHVMPYSYMVWLLILLTHRSIRDDRKCGEKYGKFWKDYCRSVPHKIIPGIF